MIRSVGDSIRRFIAGFLNHPLRNYIILGLSIKLFLALFAAWSDTTKFWHMWNGLSAGPESMLTFYPPPWLLTMNSFLRTLSAIQDPSGFAVADFALGEVWYLVGINQVFVTSPLFNIGLKLPLLIADIIIAFLIFQIVQERLSRNLAKPAAVLWYLNPFVILSVAVVGQNDVLVAMFMLIAFYLVLRGEYMFAGASLGLSVFFKLYNIYVLPFFLLMVAFELGRKSRSHFSHFKDEGFKNGLKFVAGAIIPLLLLTPSIFLFDYLIEAWVGVPRLAGFNLWGVVTLFPPAFPLADLAFSNFFALQRTLTIIGLVSTLFASFWIVLVNRSSPIQKMIFGTVVIISITFLTLTLANPHQLVSMFPFLVLAVGLFKKWRVQYWALSVAGLLFIVLMRGPYVFFFPLAEFTPILSIESLAQLTISWGAMSGVINRFLNRDFMLVTSALGFLVLASFLFLWPQVRRSSRREDD